MKNLLKKHSPFLLEYSNAFEALSDLVLAEVH